MLFVFSLEEIKIGFVFKFFGFSFLIKSKYTFFNFLSQNIIDLSYLLRFKSLGKYWLLLSI